MSITRHAAAVLLVLAPVGAAPGPAAAQDTPAPGALLIVGGGRQPAPLVRRFIELAGGAGQARIAVIPLAGSDPAEAGREKVEHLREHGGDGFVLLTDAGGARSDSVIDRLADATGIWFTGGSQSRITDALDGSPLLAAIRAAHRRGVVIGGTSAGAAIMSPWMITGSQYTEADTVAYLGDEFPRVARGVIETVPGFGFLPGTIIDQHFLRRERHNRLLAAVLERPDHLGVGIDESTAVEVAPDGSWQVRGESAVLIIDARDARVTPGSAPRLGAAGVHVHLLPPGSRFDPETGTAVLPASPNP